MVYTTLGPGGSINPCCGLGAVSPYEVAYSFTVTSDVVLTGALLALSEGIGSTNSVTIELSVDGANQPGATIESCTLNNALPPAGTGDGVTENSLLDPTLEPGTQYWFTVFCTSSGNGVNWDTGDVVNPSRYGERHKPGRRNVERCANISVRQRWIQRVRRYGVDSGTGNIRAVFVRGFTAVATRVQQASFSVATS